MFLIGFCVVWLKRSRQILKRFLPTLQKEFGWNRGEKIGLKSSFHLFEIVVGSRLSWGDVESIFPVLDFLPVDPEKFCPLVWFRLLFVLFLIFITTFGWWRS